MDATLKGVVCTSTTAQQQPTATVYDRSSQEVNDAPAPRAGKGRQELTENSKADAYETVVAVGGGPQLFPGKGGPYGARNDDTASGVNDEERHGLIEGLKKLADDADDGVRRGRKVIWGGWGPLRRGKKTRGAAFNVFDQLTNT